MKLLQAKIATIAPKQIKVQAPAQAPAPTASPREIAEKPRYTLRLEGGMIHINNIGASHEGVTYTLMAQNQDGSTKLMTRYIALAPYQVFEDHAEGLNVVAAWTKN